MVIRDNRVLGNDSLGVIVIVQNGHHPDPVRAITPGADLVYDGTGTGTCFADDVFATEFPTRITEQFPCSN